MIFFQILSESIFKREFFQKMLESRGLEMVFMKLNKPVRHITVPSRQYIIYFWILY